MENHGNTPTAILNVIISMASALIAISDLQAFVSIAAGLVAIVSGVLASRHFYYATKNIKKDEKHS